MYKFYILLGLLPIMQINATETMHEHSPKGSPSEHFREQTKPDTTQRKIMYSHSSESIAFDEFHGDPYELEEKYLSSAKSGDFHKAAAALVGSGISGNSECLDYVLKVDPQAPKYIQGGDVTNTKILISKIEKSLENQAKLYQ
jgi:hypothetical protein